MRAEALKTAIVVAILSSGILLASCLDEQGSAGGPFETFRICPGPRAQDEASIALFKAREGDTIEFCAGRFDFKKGLALQDKRGITLKGAGKDRTVFNFAGSDSPEGLYVARTQGLVLEGITIEDALQTGIFVLDSQFVTMRDLRVQWTGYETCSPDPGAANSCTKNGVIGLTPENCQHVLIEDSEVFGSSLIGIDVEAGRDVIVRRVRAERNVVGLIANNVYRGLYEDNQLTRNTAGLVINTLADYKRYGEKNVIRRNRIVANNTDNFTSLGQPLGALPRGLGVLLIAADQVELDRNEITDNDSIGIAIINGALPGLAKDPKYDVYPEGLHVHDNSFRDNGGSPSLPDPDRGPGSALTTIVVAKNHGKSAHIVWDGAVDAPNSCATVPTDDQGVALDRPNPNDAREEGRVDERGRPNFQEDDPAPTCKWNAWKFAASGELEPENKIYIQRNTFESTRPTRLLVDPFVNMYLTSSDPPQLAQDLLVPASNDLGPHVGSLPALADPALELPYVPNPGPADVRPTAAETTAACDAAQPGQVNWNALARYDCPRLDQYGLFADPSEPRHAPNGGGVPYDINTALFSDYAVKYRILFLPPGQKAVYRDFQGVPTTPTYNGFLRTLDFPVGTVIAKTFAFRKDDASGQPVSENVVETRLLIKRDEGERAVWVGLPYIWNDGPAGRTAELSVQGGTVPVEFDYLDKDPEVRDASGNRRRYTGATNYSIPEAVHCATCHGGSRREAGASPLSPKARYLNRDGACPNGAEKLNQLECLSELGLLQGLPSIGAVEKHPRWNVPGDSGEPAGSPADVDKRMRAFLEVNCAHCHSSDNKAAVSFMFLDSFRPLNRHFGICKTPIVAGHFGGRSFDIQPGDADASVLHYRDSSNQREVRMPPLARSIPNVEAMELMTNWINVALPALDAADDTAVEDEDDCGSGSPLPALP